MEKNEMIALMAASLLGPIYCRYGEPAAKDYKGAVDVAHRLWFEVLNQDRKE